MKKRYFLSLDEEVVARFRQLSDEFGLSRNQLSLSCNDFVREMVLMMETCKREGIPTIAGLFEMMGRNIQTLMEEDNVKQTPKTAGVAKGTTKRK